MRGDTTFICPLSVCCYLALLLVLTPDQPVWNHLPGPSKQEDIQKTWGKTTTTPRNSLNLPRGPPTPSPTQSPCINGLWEHQPVWDHLPGPRRTSRKSPKNLKKNNHHSQELSNLPIGPHCCLCTLKLLGKTFLCCCPLFNPPFAQIARSVTCTRSCSPPTSLYSSTFQSAIVPFNYKADHKKVSAIGLTVLPQNRFIWRNEPIFNLQIFVWQMSFWL